MDLACEYCCCTLLVASEYFESACAASDSVAGVGVP